MALFSKVGVIIDATNAGNWVKLLDGPRTVKGIHITNADSANSRIVKIGIGPSTGISNDSEITQWILTPTVVPSYAQGSSNEIVVLTDTESLYVFADGENVQFTILPIEV